LEVIILIDFKVKVNGANKKTSTYRITLPVKIAELLEVNIGDTVKYTIDSKGKVSLTIYETKE
jgi:bifunctional DNA-binding transcriptional regulator/antitoxin component of YhaV-PrlF toxin-antitoxin module